MQYESTLQYDALLACTPRTDATFAHRAAWQAFDTATRHADATLREALAIADYNAPSGIAYRHLCNVAHAHHRSAMFAAINTLRCTLAAIERAARLAAASPMPTACKVVRHGTSIGLSHR
jgi:hypothetical protein